ncbi:MAG: sigma-70 family RNA polymerase sigma factor, partial [Solibacillus sp.]
AREQSDTPLQQHEASYTTEQHLLKREQKNELLFALSQLAELDRHIFMMKYYLELTNSEIAETLGITKAAVDNRLYRGKKELAQHEKLKERFI